MKFRYLTILGAALTGLIACNFESADPGASGGPGGAGGAGGSDPEAYQEPDFELDEVGDVVGHDLSEDSGSSLELSPELYALLAAAPDGQKLTELPEVDGKAELVDFFAARLPEEGAPNAICAALTLPVDAAGCAAITPALLDGGSYDPDFPGTGASELEGLEATASESQLCGLGVHSVSLTVYDFDGKQSSCEAPVMLCDPASDDGCPDQIEKHAPTIAVGDRPARSMTCQWMRAYTVGPSALEARTLSEYSYQEKGPGPVYERISKEVDARNCFSPDHQETFSEPVGGDVDLQINVECVDASGAVVKKPQCTSDVEMRAFYRSEVRAISATGWVCGGNAVEALAQDEVAFNVNSEAVFTKAVVVQNGTEVSTSLGFNLGAGVGNSKDGVSANASIGFGWTRNVSDRTADRIDFLAADGYIQRETPITARMQGSAKTYLKIEDRAWGGARVRTGHWLMVVVGSSSCPGAGTFANARQQKRPNVMKTEVASDVTAANQFLAVRGSKLVLPP